MQKICYVLDDDLIEVDDLLEAGWTIKSVNAVPVNICDEDLIVNHTAAYIVLEK